MIICHSKRFIFIHIQKTGGTSVELALEPMLSWSDLILGSSAFGEMIDAHYKSRFGLSKHSSLAEIENICGKQICRSYAVFATVRHPLDRLCSVYNYVGSKVHDWAERHRIPLEDLAGHLTEQARAQAPVLKWPAAKAFIGTSTFSQFIRDERVRAAAPFRTQASYLRSVEGGEMRAAVFRLEDKSMWGAGLQAILGTSPTLPHSNRSRLQFITAERVSTQDRHYVEESFKEDFAAFAY